MSGVPEGPARAADWSAGTSPVPGTNPAPGSGQGTDVTGAAASSPDRPGLPDRRRTLEPELAARLKRDANGLVAAVIQQAGTGQVLMLGWMDDEALRRTLTEGRVTFWSRSRQEYWRKGDTSGHYQYVRSVSLDCDGDALLVQVDQVGAACHTGAFSCFQAGGDLGAVVGHAPRP